MASRYDKTCVMCGKHYKYCSGGCDDYRGYPLWMTSFCSDPCHTVFNVIMDYRTATKTPQECAAILKATDLSGRDKFNKSTNDFIDEILTVGAIAAAVPEVEEVVYAEDAAPVVEETAPVVEKEEATSVVEEATPVVEKHESVPAGVNFKNYSKHNSKNYKK